MNISELKVRSYQSSYFGIKQSRSEAKQSKVKQKPSKSEAKHRFEKKFFTQFSLGLTGKGLSFRISGALKG